MGLSQVLERPELLPPRRPSKHHRRRVLALVALVVAFAGSAGYWLASSGVLTPSITPPLGTPTSGQVADVTPLSSSVTRTNGSAQLQVGVELAKIVVSKYKTTNIQVNIGWTNVNQATQVLNNPNAQISIGLYHTIHAGNCNTSTSHNVDAPLVNLTDTDSNPYCAALDETATGKFASPTGKLLLAINQVSGFLYPNLDGSGSMVSPCPLQSADPNDTGSWCQATSITDANQRALFVVASIVTPGGIPQGQQASLSTLTFYVTVEPRA